jgi:16S rRNA (guanine527-N7)-methyltransferase
LEAVQASPPSCWLDLGSGGGLPGLVLAWKWPEQPATLLDANRRRTEALELAIAQLGWQRWVRILRGRAEEVGRQNRWRRSQAAVFARSFGPPAVVAECAAPLLSLGGHLVVSEPPAAPRAGEIAVAHPDRWPEDGLAVLGLRPVAFHQAEFGYQVLVQDRPCPDRFPRRTGVPGKRPLF